ncbi:MAG: hypothetical protein MJ208_01465 [Bacilli bacterium]|nr:hypothetical protein [Bacilli bacterium]
MDFKLFLSKTIKDNANIKKMIDEMFNEIKNDQELMHYLDKVGITNQEIIKNNVATIMLVKDDLDYCRKCPGFYACNKNHHHYVFTLNYDGKNIRKNLMPCELKLKDEKINEAYLIRDFPDLWRENTVNKLDKSKVRLPLIKRYKDALNSERNWIYITGSHRAGKSYAAVAILNGFIKLHKGKGAFINYPERVRELQDYTYSNKDDFANLIKLYSTVDYLVIDNFGNEYKSEYVRDAITLAILNERARRGLVTIFTSEFDFDDISYMYSLNAAGKARGRQLKNLLERYAIEPIDISTAAIY